MPVPSPPGSHGPRHPGPEPGGRTRAVPRGNRLLAALPRQESVRLLALLQDITLVPGEVLVERGQGIEHVVFPDSGLVSLLTDFGPGERAEIGLIGREGMLGLTALLGGRTAPYRAVVRIAGEARRMPVGALRASVHGSFAVRDLVLRHAALRLAQAATGAACIALHPVRQRAARWLLDIQDRTGPGFLLTQEFLADMLGVRRPTVNAVLQDLKGEGLLSTARGRIVITDPAALEAVACGCRQRLRGIEAEFRAGGDGAGRPDGAA
jgi:CRP-like cAMP-binding protein